MEGSDEHGETPKAAAPLRRGVSRGVSILDLILRIVAIIGTLSSAIAMGTTNQFFVVANSVVSAYLILSLPLSVVHIIRSRGKYSRMVLIFFDVAMLALVIAEASAATTIVYLAHRGNVRQTGLLFASSWILSDRISGSLVGSFAAMVVLILLIFLSAISLARR